MLVASSVSPAMLIAKAPVVASPPAEFGGISVVNSGRSGRSVTVNPDFTVRASGFPGNPPVNGRIDAKQGAALLASVKTFLDSTPPTAQGTAGAGSAESRIALTWAGEPHTFTVNWSSAGGQTPETLALVKAVMEAGNTVLA